MIILSKREMQTESIDQSETQRRILLARMALDRAMVSGVKNPLWFGFPSRLLAARSSADLSMNQLESLSLVTQSVIANSENGVTVPRIVVVERLAYALGISPVWLAFGHDGEEPFAERIKRSLLSVPRDPRPGQSQRCPDGFRALPRRVTEARTALGLSMRALGLGAGMTGPAIEKIEKGKSVPRIDSVEALAKVLGVSPGWLAFGIGRGPGGKKYRLSVLATST